jgi:hypothetical protein
MSGRIGGAPSTRGWRLAYYYTRLLIVLLTSYTRPRQRQRTDPPAAEAMVDGAVLTPAERGAG